MSCDTHIHAKKSFNKVNDGNIQISNSTNPINSSVTFIQIELRAGFQT